MLETITLGGGCFWCLEAVFQRVVGVSDVTSGYMGGYVDQPLYNQVCQGNTGHAEVVQIQFDPHQITLNDLLDIFFVIHNPTTLNQQGHDVGTQYRSAIFTESSAHAEVARAKIAALAGDYSAPIVTELATAAMFWPAELEHHDYYRQHPNQPYCMAVVEPKLQKFLQHFAEKAK
ncbi:peptide-methionine (S)-S-oxide reductase MsrA [Deefgea rivuli]|uniref:peptide-methionine (S)-S-oxide reductase MsrA n=1 Tax=Deefgea rivuli TaxID=400948 RepID=UPI000481388B|nr:peptide-methionine (S)-S-oxide reductase MsrA [Deefgea rivuli]